ELQLAAGPPAIATHVRDQLVEARIREGVVLHLADRPPAGHAQPDRRADDARFRERRVEAAIRSEPVPQPRGRTEDAAGAPDVLAEHEDRWIALELDVERVVDRLDDAELRHRGSSAAPRGRSRTTPADRRMRAQRGARDPQAARPPPQRFPRASPPSPRRGSIRPT